MRRIISKSDDRRTHGIRANRLEQMLWFRGVEPANQDLPERIVLKAQRDNDGYRANLDKLVVGKNSNHKNRSKGRKIMNNIGIATIGLALLTSAPAFGASSNDASDQPQVQIANGIQYFSGGVGIDERQILQQEAKGSNLELSFALLNKQYLGGADLIIKDSKGTNVFEGASEGPLFYTKLPQGAYTVEATVEGKTLTQVVHIPPKGQAQVFFAWPPAQESNYDTASN